MFYLNTIEQLFLFIEQLNQLEVCLTYSRLLAGIQILAVYRNLGWNSNKTSLYKMFQRFFFTEHQIFLIACSFQEILQQTLCPPLIEV